MKHFFCLALWITLSSFPFYFFQFFLNLFCGFFFFQPPKHQNSPMFCHQTAFYTLFCILFDSDLIFSHSFNWYLHVDDYQIYFFSPDFFSELQVYMFNRVLSIYIWMPHMYFKSICPWMNSLFHVTQTCSIFHLLQ